MGIRNYKDLKVWQAGMRLSVEIYKCTEALPRSEQFGLTAQMRRSAIGVPANIAEGYLRQHDKELCQFLHVALGSLAELETYMHLCERLGYLRDGSLNTLLGQVEGEAKMLRGLIARTRGSGR